MSDEASSSAPKRGTVDFHTTHWSVVLRAGGTLDDSAGARAALAELCRTYWYPLYAYVRRRSRDEHEARDRTQEFFARLLEKNTIAVARPERGRFRAFLLTALKNFLAGQHEQAAAQKRGGGRSPLSLDFERGEERFRREPADELTPEKLFDRQWALALLDRVVERLCGEYEQAGKLAQFDVLKPFLVGRHAESDDRTAAAALGTTPGAVRVAAHRLRRRYRDLLRAEIAQTVSGPDEVEDELRSLFAVLGS